MNKTLRAITISTAVLLAAPAMAKCGEDGVLETVEKTIRQNYFKGDDFYFREWKETPKELTLEMVRVTGRDRELGIYKCSAMVEFEASGFEAAYFAGLSEAGPQSVPVRYEVSPDARDPDEDIITVYRIRALGKNPNL